MPVDVGARPSGFQLPVVGEEESANLAHALQRGPVLISIYKTSCRASKAAFPFLERIFQSYPADQLTVWGVSLDSPTVTSSFMRRYDITFPNLVDEEGYPTARSFGVEETPSTFLIDQSSEVIWRGLAFDKAEMSELSATIAALVGAPVADITSNTDDVPDTVPG